MAVFSSSFKYNLAIGAVISGLKVNSLLDLSLKLYSWSTISSRSAGLAAATESSEAESRHLASKFQD